MGPDKPDLIYDLVPALPPQNKITNTTKLLLTQLTTQLDIELRAKIPGFLNELFYSWYNSIY